MDVIEAVAWVDRHHLNILKSVVKYTTYAPYSAEDFLQDAYEAAIRAAAIVSDNPALNFNGVFRNIHLQYIFRVTPFPEEERKRLEDEKIAAKAAYLEPPVDVVLLDNDDISEKKTDSVDKTEKKKHYPSNVSMSFPCNKRDDEFQFESVPLELATRLDLEDMYRNNVKEHLTPREQVVMEYSLGLTEKGYLSSYEIGEELGVNSATARKLLSRAISKAQKIADIRSIARPSPIAVMEQEYYEPQRQLSAA